MRGFLAHLSRRLNWACLIKNSSSSSVVVVFFLFSFSSSSQEPQNQFQGGTEVYISRTFFWQPLLWLISWYKQLDWPVMDYPKNVLVIYKPHRKDIDFLLCYAIIWNKRKKILNKFPDNFFFTCSYFLYVCLFYCVPLENFHSFGDVTIAAEGLQFFTNARHVQLAIEQWGFLSVPHLLWQGHPFNIVISEDPWHSNLKTLCRALRSGAVPTYFNNLGLSQLGFEHRTCHLRGNRSNRLRYPCGPLFCVQWNSFRCLFC